MPAMPPVTSLAEDFLVRSAALSERILTETANREIRSSRLAWRLSAYRAACVERHLKLNKGGLSDEWTIQLLQLQHAGECELVRQRYVGSA